MTVSPRSCKERLGKVDRRIWVLIFVCMYVCMQCLDCPFDSMRACLFVQSPQKKKNKKAGGRAGWAEREFIERQTQRR